MIWTVFSMLLFFGMGLVASQVFGGFIFLLVALIAAVALIKTIQGSSPLSEVFHGR